MGISKHDKQALADLFIALGTPLVSALQTVESWSGETLPLPKKAENLAKLLNVTVDFATKITRKLDIRDAYTLETVRGKIIRIVTPVIAETYIANGEAPKEDTLKELTDLFDVLLSFADSVSPEDDKSVKPHKMAAMIEACEPVLSAVKSHSFGLPQETVFAGIADGIHNRSAALADRLHSDDAVQSGLFRAVAGIYAASHNALTARIEAGQSDIDGEDALKAVWQDCDERLAMMQGLAGYVGDSIAMPVKPAARPEAAETTFAAAKQADKSAAPRISSDADNGSGSEDGSGDGDSDDSDFNPMAFFTGRKG